MAIRSVYTMISIHLRASSLNSLGPSCCVSNAKLRLAVGLSRLESCAWIYMFNFWLNLIYSPSDLAPLIFKDEHPSDWMHLITEKLKSYGLSMEYLLPLGYDNTMVIRKRCIIDMECQTDLSQAPSLIRLGATKPSQKAAKYLYDLMYPGHRRAMTLARLDVLPSSVLEGHSQRFDPESDSTYLVTHFLSVLIMLPIMILWRTLVHLGLLAFWNLSLL
ncbi:uncharacterized protein LOC128326416 [Hemicordylus capensis]|uniref:uncharacterized protein LOC128326416 n=1 Tax=Hemicordylus capensis TaxID=884348 RepID=UPI0023036590|nr:uncharacterized protein LOC128326416 [Hemicordylus capensis]